MKFRLSFSLKQYCHAELITALGNIEGKERADFLVDLASECLEHRRQSEKPVSKVKVIKVDEPSMAASSHMQPEEVLHVLDEDELKAAFGRPRS